MTSARRTLLAAGALVAAIALVALLLRRDERAPSRGARGGSAPLSSGGSVALAPPVAPPPAAAVSSLAPIASSAPVERRAEPRVHDETVTLTTVRGRVTRGRGSERVAGARVWAFVSERTAPPAEGEVFPLPDVLGALAFSRQRFVLLASTVSEAGGVFTLTPATKLPRFGKLIVVAAVFAPAGPVELGWSRDEPIFFENDGVLSIDVSISRLVTLTVAVRASGASVEGATVHYGERGEDESEGTQSRYADGATDASGLAVRLTSSPEARVTVMKAGFATEIRRVLLGELENRIDVDLRPETRFTGRVLDASGKPVRARIKATELCPPGSTEPFRGRSFSGESLRGRIASSFATKAWRSSARVHRLPSRSSRARRRSPSSISRTPGRTVTGRILDARGHALAGAKVSIGYVFANRSVSYETDSGDDGSFTLAVFRGKATLSVQKSGYKAVSIELGEQVPDISLVPE